MLSITRRFEFDYGHRVLGHGGRCQYLHGHRGVAEVTVKAPGLDKLGMVIDFAEVKRLIGTWIDDNWDHNLLLNSGDPQISHLEETEDRIPFCFHEANPTAENMAKYLYQVAVQLLPPTMTVVKVRLYETPNSYADYQPTTD